MKEQSPYEHFIDSLTPARPEVGPTRESGWDPQAIGAYLDSTARPVVDPVFAEGFEYDVDFVSSTLEVYPERETVIFKNEDVKVEWYQAEQPTLINEPGRQGVTFVKTAEDKLYNLSIETSGAVVFAIFPVETPPPARPYATPGPEMGKPLPQTEEDGGKAKHEKDPRVEISGRVGKDPILKKTVKGQDVLTFSVAVANGTEKPDWHRMVAFGSRALALAESLHRGDKVNVVGYEAKTKRMETDTKTGQQVEKQYTLIRVHSVEKPE